MSEEKEVMHWADQQAQRVIKEKGDKDSYTCASGITPSGVVHIGNFREIITTELIVRALKDLGKDVRFIYSWDNYDVFRKVPKGMPQPEMLHEHLRKPIVDIPDPFETEDSYARHNEVEVEKAIAQLNIFPEFLYQAQKYRDLEYVEGMKIALQNKDKIRDVLDKYRKEPLKEAWLPISGYCPECGDDRVSFTDYDGDNKIKMHCNKCENDLDVEIDKSPFLKLPWRVDWPMRWKHENVDFEPCGKDHSTPGGSFQTSDEICQAIYDHNAPTNIGFEFVSVKGQGGKISSSKGGVITLWDVLEVYEPEMVRYLFAGSRPSAEFSISFDLDVMKIYADFDKVERIYYDQEPDVSDKEKSKQKRIYKLSCIDQPNEQMPFQPSFRHLCNQIMIYENDFDKIKEFYKDDLKTEFDTERLKLRATCAKNWLDMYAPDNMKFEVLSEPPREFDGKEKQMLKELADVLRKGESDQEKLFNEFYEIITKNDSSPKEFFKVCYNLMIDRNRGPKLAPFILEVGVDRVLALIDKV